MEGDSRSMIKDIFKAQIIKSCIASSLMVARLIELDNEFYAQICRAFNRFKDCDWGELCQEDVDDNNQYLCEPSHSTLGIYTTKYGPVWIKTEAERMVTLIFFPSEY